MYIFICHVYTSGFNDVRSKASKRKMYSKYVLLRLHLIFFFNVKCQSDYNLNNVPQSDNATNNHYFTKFQRCSAKDFIISQFESLFLQPTIILILIQVMCSVFDYLFLSSGGRTLHHVFDQNNLINLNQRKLKIKNSEEKSKRKINSQYHFAFVSLNDELSFVL